MKQFSTCLHADSNSNDDQTCPILQRAISSLGWGTARRQCKTYLIFLTDIRIKSLWKSKRLLTVEWEHHSGIQWPVLIRSTRTRPAERNLILQPQLECKWGVTTKTCVGNIPSSVSPFQIIRVSLPERIFQDITVKRPTVSVPPKSEPPEKAKAPTQHSCSGHVLATLRHKLQFRCFTVSLDYQTHCN